MKKDLGFLCLDLKQSPEHNMLVGVIKELIDNNPFNQICIFNHSSLRTGYDNVPVLPVSHCKFFEGDLFLFDTLSLSMSKDFPGIRKKYFYCSDVLWSAQGSYYEAWRNLLKDSSLQIITSNARLQEIYKICWDIDTINIQNFSYKELQNAIQ